MTPAATATARRQVAARRSRLDPDRRAELVLGALSCAVLALIAGMVIFVFSSAWPSFQENGLNWFLPSDANVDNQIDDIIDQRGGTRENPQLKVSAWPLLVGTAMTTFAAVAIGLGFAILAAIFIVEFAPPRVKQVLEPVVRLLAAVPSVVYGLIGILVLAPFLDDVFVSQKRAESVEFVIQLTGDSLLLGTLILVVMITPIMIAIIVDALRAIPKAWTEGAAALGVNRWRIMWTVSVRAARPAIIAGAVLAIGRALGEAIMLAMVSGSKGFAPNPLDGLTFFLEPTRPLAATIVSYQEAIAQTQVSQTLYAFAAVLLVSTMFMSLGGWALKQPLKRYGAYA